MDDSCKMTGSSVQVPYPDMFELVNLGGAIDHTQRVKQLEECGAILIRAYDYVAWRSQGPSRK